MLKKIIFLFWIPWKKAKEKNTKEKRRENATKKKKIFLIFLEKMWQKMHYSII